MEVINSIEKIRKICEGFRKNNEIVGLVPTMGYLHEGHVSLIKKSKKMATKTIISIFVNPTQFGPNEDYNKYPRDIKRDKAIAEDSGVDCIFYPTVNEMYKSDYKTYVEVKELSNIMCGKFRPGHFTGVCTIVLKLLNIINPHIAFFGKKDYQQFIIIKKMVSDLNFPVKIIGCPTIREKDGLALSSRNKYLSNDERAHATLIYSSLKKARDFILEFKQHKNIQKENKNGKIKMNLKLKSFQEAIVQNLLNDSFVSKVDYFDFRDSENLGEIDDLEMYYLKKPKGKILVAAAVWIGNTRLIDNIIV